jgi:hypothetical protein
MAWVNVYEVTREYGGPEEGGWWYNRYECIDSVHVKGDTDATVVRLKDQYQDRAYGNIYSVRGGLEIKALIEDEKAQSETRERPRYE